MRLTVLAPLVVAVAGLGAVTYVVHADDTKETKKDDKSAKKADGCGDGCCGDEAKKTDEAAKKDDTAKKDGCDKCEKGEGTCEGCGKGTSTFAKAIDCKDCAASTDGPCASCKTALKEGKVFFVPVSGIMCGNCEGAVSAKLEKIDLVQKYAVSSRFNGIAVFVEPGKTLKLSEIKKALGDGKFAIDETAKLAGHYTLVIAGEHDQTQCSTACEILCKLLGITDCKSCCRCTADGFEFDASGKDVSIKKIKDALDEKKIALADIELRAPAPKAEDAKKGS